METLESRKMFAVATGDFNGDGEDDLAIGVPGEDVGSVSNAGAVNVIYGHEDHGLVANPQGSTPDDQLWTQDSPGVASSAEAGDRFGSALATGDFNSDGFDDLAIGVPGEDVGSIPDAGAVNVLYGSPSGLRASAAGTTPNDQIWHQNSSGIHGVAEAFDAFGSALATGDFNNDGEDDLAIGVPGENVGSVKNAGAVNVLYGHWTNGLVANQLGTARNDQIWHQDSSGIQGRAQVGDKFGTALAVGDFNSDGEDDLAIGIPGKFVHSSSDAGAVHVIYGHASNGLVANQLGTARNDQVWNQNSSGIVGVAEVGDRFGSALAAGDFNGDGEDDLAIGVPGEDIGSISNAGGVNVIYGHTTNGLIANQSGSTPNDDFWSQDSFAVQGKAEADDAFGSALAAGDFNSDGEDDLAIGIPGEDFGGKFNAGAVSVLYGNEVNGLFSNPNGTTPNDDVWHQDTSGIAGLALSFDAFGSSLAVGDFNGDGEVDLAIGVPGKNVGGHGNTGAVNVIYGETNDGLVANQQGSARDDQFWHQDSNGIKGVAEAGDGFSDSTQQVAPFA